MSSVRVRENTLPLINTALESATCTPRALRRNELPRMRTSCEANTPSPSPSGTGLSLPALSRITLRADRAITKPKNWFLDEDTPSTRFSRALAMSTPVAKPSTEPFRTVTPSWPSFNTPKSHASLRGRHCANGAPSPSITWPFRSSVTPSAPIRTPLFGQSVRSLSSVVSAVIVSPHFTSISSFDVAGVAPRAATVAIRASALLTMSFCMDPPGVSGCSGPATLILGGRRRNGLSHSPHSWHECRLRLSLAASPAELVAEPVEADSEGEDRRVHDGVQPIDALVVADDDRLDREDHRPENEVAKQ